MPKISQEKIIIAGCIAAILFTLFIKSSLHKSTEPQLYQTSSLIAAKQQYTEDITVYFHERRPFYVSHNNEARGVVANPISQAFTSADIPFHWQETPAKRQLDIIRDNIDTSCAAGWFKTPERETFGQYSLPIYQDKPFVAITRADNILLGASDNLDRVFKERRLQVLIKSGYSYGPYIDDRLLQLKPRQVVTTVDNQSLLRMIKAYRADYCFMTEEEAQDLLLFGGENGSDFKTVYFVDMPQGNKRYLICSKLVDKGIMKRLNQAIRHLQGKEERSK